MPSTIMMYVLLAILALILGVLAFAGLYLHEAAQIAEHCNITQDCSVRF